MAGSHEWGKHRTEATEVTEGDWSGGESSAVNAGASGGGIARMGKASTEHRGHGGGLEWWRKLGSERWSFRWRDRANGESIAQRPQRTRRGIGSGGENSSVNAGASGGGSHEWGKHRTEAAEVTEGDWERWRKLVSERWSFRWRDRANGESIARRPQRSRRGLGAVGKARQ